MCPRVYRRPKLKRPRERRREGSSGDPLLPREVAFGGSPSPRLSSHRFEEFALVLDLSLLGGNKECPLKGLQKRSWLCLRLWEMRLPIALSAKQFLQGAQNADK
jgi:hypothetical protein